MVWQQTPFTLPLAIAAGLSAVLTLLGTFRLRGTTAAVRWTFVGVTTSGAVWSAAYGLQLASADLPSKLAWAGLAWIGIAGMVVSWPAFVVAYVGRSDLLTPRNLAALALVPAVWLAIVWTGSLGELAVADLALDTSGAFAVIDVTPGPLMWAFIGYTYVVDVLAAATLAWLVIRSRGLHRQQATVVLVAGSIPVLVSWLGVADVLPYLNVDPTPLSFAVTTLLIAAAISRYGFLDIVPVPRGSILAHLDVGLVVVDSRRRVVDVSETAAAYLGLDDTAILGEPAETALDDHPGLLDGVRDPERETVELATQRGKYEAKIFRTQRGARSGDVVLLIRDVTEQKERAEALERQNERLEKFAGIISHDVRNPLNVAQGQLELARETGAAKHFEAVGRAHDRIAAIVDDVLELTRTGRTAQETEVVDLETVVDAAWTNVDTVDADVTVAAGIEFTADRSQLVQLLENLFRNAVEHAGPDATIRIGGDADSFYVEDDGPGIPRSDGETVFEPGYSTGDDGIGMGLAIVREIAHAHGWDVRVTDGRDGGARFEFDGVDGRSPAEAEDLSRPIR